MDEEEGPMISTIYDELDIINIQEVPHLRTLALKTIRDHLKNQDKI